MRIVAPILALGLVALAACGDDAPPPDAAPADAASADAPPPLADATPDDAAADATVYAAPIDAEHLLAGTRTCSQVLTLTGGVRMIGAGAPLLCHRLGTALQIPRHGRRSTRRATPRSRRPTSW